MGFRFRKSFGSGPFRINVSKSGIGYSIGGKGFRYTKKSGGGTRTTISIPGTGISYVKDHSDKKRGSAVKQSKKSSSRNRIPENTSPQLQSQTLRVSGLSLFVDNLKKLAKFNPDWRLSPEEILAAGKDGQKIFQCKFINAPLELIPDNDYEDDPNAVSVLIAGYQVGYIESAASAHVRKLLKAGSIKSMTCGIFGGKYKIVDETRNATTHSSTINVAVKITYTAELAAAPAGVKTSKKQKKAKAKKPIYKRWWFWALLLVLLFGGSKNGEDSPAVTEPVDTTAAIVETANIPESKAIETEAAPAESVIETLPSSEAADEAAPVAAAVVPVPVEETAAPIETPETEPEETEDIGIHYVLNISSDIFHYEDCRGVKQMKDKNREDFYGTRDEVIARGFKSCGICHP